MRPGLRKVALTAHVAFSVGWLGAVVASLAFGIGGLTVGDASVVRAIYLTMELAGWFVLIPFSVASLLSGLVVALGTRWGLFRHYWVLVKLVMNVFATVILLAYMQTLSYLADIAAASTMANGDPSTLRDSSPVFHATGALVLLVVATILSVYKPQGLTRYGQRRQKEQRQRPQRLHQALLQP